MTFNNFCLIDYAFFTLKNKLILMFYYYKIELVFDVIKTYFGINVLKTVSSFFYTSLFILIYM